MEHHQVIICGAGPSGMALALFLSRYGIKPILIEKREKRSSWSKAGTLQPRTLEVIDDLGLIDSFLEAGKIISINNFYDGAKKLLTLNYGMLPTKHNYLLSIPQYETERILENALNGEGIFIRRGYEVEDLEHTSEKNLITFRDIQSGESIKQTSDYLIAADGGKSTLRKLLIEEGEIQLKQRRRYPTNFIMGDFEIEDYPFSLRERHIHFAKRNLVSFIPMPGESVRIVAMQHEKISADVQPTIDEFSKLVERVVGKPLKLSNPTGLSRFYPAKFMLDRARIGNIFFVGDAAHIVSPISGQGINLAIEEAYNLGWKMGCVLKKNEDDALLDSFYPERSIHVKQILDHSDRNQSMVSTSIGNYVFRWIMRMAKAEREKHKIIKALTLFDVDFDQSKTHKENGKFQCLRKGSRMTDKRVLTPNGRKGWLFEEFPYESHTLVFNAFSKEYGKEEGSIARKTIDKFDDLSIIKIAPEFDSEDREETLVIDRGSELAHRLELSPPLIMIRPDKFIKETYGLDELNGIIDKHAEILKLQLLVLI